MSDVGMEWQQAERIAKALEELAMWAHENSKQHRDNVLDLLNLRDKQLTERNQQLKEAKDAIDKLLAEYEPSREEV